MSFWLTVSCLIFSMSLAVGQLLFKLAANDFLRLKGGSWLHMLLSPSLVSAFALYGLTSLLWIWILTQLPLSRAYPFALLGAATVPLFARILLGEALSPLYGIGILCVLVGLAIVNLG
jgi:drug/metabolite transporter (DMT)-like permease